VTIYRGTQSDCSAVSAARDKLLGPPVKGVHVGGGIHVAMPESWNGDGDVPLGWTGYQGPKQEGQQWSVDPGNGQTDAALKTTAADVLTVQEKTLLQTAVATATVSAEVEAKR
jgi:hypothetical protein